MQKIIDFSIVSDILLLKSILLELFLIENPSAILKRIPQFISLSLFFRKHVFKVLSLLSTFCHLNLCLIKPSPMLYLCPHLFLPKQLIPIISLKYFIMDTSIVSFVIFEIVELLP